MSNYIEYLKTIKIKFPANAKYVVYDAKNTIYTFSTEPEIDYKNREWDGMDQTKICEISEKYMNGYWGDSLIEIGTLILSQK